MSAILRFFTEKLNIKLIALAAAIVVWGFVNQSINETKTLIGIPIRIVNLPSTKTVEGLQPNGYLGRKITLTLTGTKKIIESIEPGDLEVILDASNQPNEWVAEVTKKNLNSLNPNIDLQQELQTVQAQELIVRLSRLVTTEIPIEIEDPNGNLPKDYLYLGIWPRHLVQSVSGPEDQIDRLKIEGLELNFNLDDISKADLAELKGPPMGKFGSDVLYFKVPEDWKKVHIPFLSHPEQPMNDPHANDLWIELLKKNFIPLKQNIPIRIFYPLDTADTLNPETLTLATNALVERKNGLDFFKIPLYAYEVSRLFVDTIKDNIEIAIIASDSEKQLRWSLEYLEPQDLEDRYVAFLNNQYRDASPDHRSATRDLENMWRKRFRDYMQNLMLYQSKHNQLDLDIRIRDGKIVVEEDAS